jgi:hypothetical protein
MDCKGSRRASCKANKSCLYTRTSDKRKSYCRRSRTSKRTGTVSACRGTSNTDCIGQGCLLAAGPKRSYCRKPKNRQKTRK